MKVLYIVALFSFLVLAWAVYAITRHVRRNAAQELPQMQDPELTEAIDLRLSGLTQPARDAPTAKSATMSTTEFSYTRRDRNESTEPPASEHL